jgi:hypothetical protein
MPSPDGVEVTSGNEIFNRLLVASATGSQYEQ